MKRRSPKSLHSSDSFRRFVLDQLASVEVTSRAMFGGLGLYSGDIFFGIVASDILYLKVDDGNREMFETAGMKPFKPYAGRPLTMKYYAVPLDVLESAVELERWVRASIAAARRAKKL